MQRVMCVWFPDWPIQRFCAGRPELKGQPLVLFAPARRGGGLVVAHCSRNPHGIFPGMPLAEAQALCPGLRVEPQDQAADIDALRALAGECQQFSPIVGLGEEASLLMDLTGCAHLFGGEPSLLRLVARFLSRAGLAGRISIADTIGAAWGFCRYGRGGIVPPGGNERALAALSVAALRLDPATVETLAELEIHTVGALRALPRASLPARFGTAIANRLDQAFGNRPERIVPVKKEEPVYASWTLDEPLTERRSLEIALHQLLERISHTLQERQLGVERLTCQIGEVSFTVGTTRPVVSVPHLWELVRLHLERLDFPGEVRHVEIQATMTARRREQQQQIIPDERQDQRELQRLLDRLGSRLGTDAVLRPSLVFHAVPELACRFTPILEEGQNDAATNPVGKFRPVRVYPQPVPVEVVSLFPDGSPSQFRWKNRDRTVSDPVRPERIVTGWWNEKPLQRDYYRAEIATGERYWLFQNAEGGWFLHGGFA